MKHAHSTRSRLGRGLFACAATALLAAGAHAQMPDASQIPLKEQLALCRAGHTWETQQACTHETLAVHQARRTGQIGAYPPANYAANSLARCNIYRDQEDVLACRARVMGVGQVTGSVAGGGILRQYQYQVPLSQQELQQEANAGQQQGQAPSTQSLGAPAVNLGQYRQMQPILGKEPAFPMFQDSNR